MTQNIILIGMPSSGKSTIGAQLAKPLGLNFIDTDHLIQNHHRQTLQTILQSKGYQALRDIEAQTLFKLQLQNDLVATGGSAVYNDAAMQHLKQQGKIVFLEVSLTEILKRIDNEDSRGIARPANQTIEDVYNERQPLYRYYADITIDNNRTVTMAMLEQLLT